MLWAVIGLEILIASLIIFVFLKRGSGDQAQRLARLEELMEQAERRKDTDSMMNRKELNDNFAQFRSESSHNFAAQSDVLRSAFSDFMKFLLEFRDALNKSEEQTTLKLSESLNENSERSERRFSELVKTLFEFQTNLRENLTKEFERNRATLEQSLKTLREENTAKLDEMKKTVDEKLQESVEKHFNESFKLISERLEQVHKGLGEMQTLASGVGDLKKVLTNVKTRGNLGEIQLSTILEQYLAPDQYVANVATVPDSRELVEFAIRMPGASDGENVYLPVDSKFPVEDYARLLEACEVYPRMSPELKKAQDDFARTVKKCASDIHSKYIYPPHTTAFGIMFVPSEGIYAEILRLPGLFEVLQNTYQISVVGPSNLVAFLNSLQMGFKTLAIEKRSNDVWKILGSVKTEFSKFGDEMESTRKSLQAVVNHVDKIGTRSRALERQLKDVQELPAIDAPQSEPDKKDDGEGQLL